MDAIVVGIRTVLSDDPLLTARPAGPRTAVRIVFDSQARLPHNSQLVRTADQAPLMIVTAAGASREKLGPLRALGVEICECPTAPGANASRPDPGALLAELGRRRMTSVLVEGGGELLGSFFDRQLIDEYHVFVAPKLLGGSGSKSPLAGAGRQAPSEFPDIADVEMEILDGDIYIHGPARRATAV